MSSDIALHTEQLGKCYRLYERPRDRLKQCIVSALQGMLGQIPTNYFREFWALRNVSFTIKKGETIGIIGRNGSGKSTLLQILTGILKPTIGVIEVKGRVAALLELGAGFHPEFTGRENVYMNAMLLGLSRKRIDERFDAIVAFADIDEHIDRPVKTYSSGMYVRLAFAVIAHVDADILVIDEALAVGDIKFQQKCMRCLTDFQNLGKTLILVSHDLGTIKALCRTAVCLDDGTIVDQGDAGQVVDRYVLREARVHLAADAWYGETREQALQEASVTAIPFASVLAESTPSKCFRRSSNGRVNISRVELQDESGQPVSTVQFGQTGNLVVHLKATSDCPRLTVAFYVKDRSRLEVIGTNNDNEGVPVLAVEAGRVYSFQFGFPVRLKQGAYSVTVIAANGPQSPDYYDWIEDAISFEVLHSGPRLYALYSPAVAINVSSSAVSTR